MKHRQIKSNKIVENDDETKNQCMDQLTCEKRAQQFSCAQRVSGRMSIYTHTSCTNRQILVWPYKTEGHSLHLCK